MSRASFRVIKVGGSLLDCTGLGDDLQQWLSGLTPARDILVAGGGGWADLVRQADARFGLNQQTAHWLCIRAMRMTARLLAELLPQATLVSHFDQLSRFESRGGPAVFDPWSFLRLIEPHSPGPRLPESWDVTSDSIAARLAMVLDADELVLLKSAPPSSVPSGGQIHIDPLARAGYVDRFFAAVAAHVPRIRIVDFRSAAHASWTVTSPPTE